MKVIISILVTSVIIFSQSYCANKKSPKPKEPLPFPSTLDSLQGKWIGRNDSLHFLNITGRLLDEYYTGDGVRHKYYNLYFSDTLVDGEQYSYSEAKINTAATMGKFLIKVGFDGDLWCYKMDGFFKTGNTWVLSITDTWAKRTPSVFQRQ